jgi:uroporphyrinogen decarboxylase
VNKIERVRAALAGKPVDVIPASFWFHFPAEQRAAHAMAAAHLAYYRAANPDFLKVMNDNVYALAGLDAIREPGDWRRLRPAPLNSQPYQDQLAGLHEIVDAVGSETLVITTIFNPYATGNDISDRMVTDHLKADPAAVGAGLAAIAESLARFAQACIEAGAAGIYFSAQGGEAHRFTDAEFDRYIKPADLTVLNAAASTSATFNLLHICGQGLRMTPYADYPAHAVNWAPQLGNLSLRAGRELFRRPIVGGVDQRGVIVNGIREQITAEVESAVMQLGREGTLIGAGCTLPSDIDVQRIVWATEAAHAL